MLCLIDVEVMLSVSPVREDRPSDFYNIVRRVRSGKKKCRYAFAKTSAEANEEIIFVYTVYYK